MAIDATQTNSRPEHRGPGSPQISPWLAYFFAAVLAGGGGLYLSGAVKVTESADLSAAYAACAIACWTLAGKVLIRAHAKRSMRPLEWLEVLALAGAAVFGLVAFLRGLDSAWAVAGTTGLSGVSVIFAVLVHYVGRGPKS